MKKILFFLVTIIGLAFNSNAQEGSCIIPGTNDYIQVVFDNAPSENRNGSSTHFVISNSSVKPMVSAQVVITAEIRTCFGVPECNIYKSVTLYSGTVRDVVAFGNKPVNFDLLKYVAIKNISVKVSNPSCKDK